MDHIFDLIAPLVANQTLLPREKLIIQQEIHLTWVFDKDSQIIGSINLTPFSKYLYEIRALAVNYIDSGMGVGTALLSALESYIKTNLSVPVRLFALTYQTSFFFKHGFKIVNKEKFPQKVYEVCQYCSKKDDCQETAVEKEIT